MQLIFPLIFFRHRGYDMMAVVALSVVENHWDLKVLEITVYITALVRWSSKLSCEVTVVSHLAVHGAKG
jgi:hypothetical protein